MRRLWLSLLAFALTSAPITAAWATPQFVNGLTLDGAMLDRSGGRDANTGRVGYFSDIYYDPHNGHWWALSDRGPGGGTLSYDTRVQRFKVKIDKNTGAISKFKIVETIIFKDELGDPLNGRAPNPTSVLGGSFDPEGIVVHPKTGHLLVSDEYGPSLYEFDRRGRLVRRFITPANLIPRNGATNVPNFADDTGNTAGKRTNRGFEGLAISPDGAHAYAMLQSAMLDEGAGNGFCNRIVKFDTLTGDAVAQYAYRMEAASQGRGISALVAINEREFFVLERNNRGIGVGAEATPPNKKVFRIDIRFSDADPFVTSIQCPLDTKTNCFLTTGGGPAPLTADYKLLPGVLHAYRVSTADLGNYVPPISGHHGHDGDEDDDDDSDDD